MRWQTWDALRNHRLTGAEPRWFAYAVGADIPAEPLPAITPEQTLPRKAWQAQLNGVACVRLLFGNEKF